MKTTRKEALERIEGTLTSDKQSVIYYDDNMQKFYLSPIEDLQDLQDLMDDDDEDVSRDAYSHWCAGTSHQICDAEGNLE